jgi:hypothetical protein
VGELSFDLGPTADYGDVIERGVPHPFVIRARDGGTLHFVIDGHDVFAKSVTHPPIAPQPVHVARVRPWAPQLEDALGISASRCSTVANTIRAQLDHRRV